MIINPTDIFETINVKLWDNCEDEELYISFPMIDIVDKNDYKDSSPTNSVFELSKELLDSFNSNYEKDVVTLVRESITKISAVKEDVKCENNFLKLNINGTVMEYCIEDYYFKISYSCMESEEYTNVSRKIIEFLQITTIINIQLAAILTSNLIADNFYEDPERYYGTIIFSVLSDLYGTSIVGYDDLVDKVDISYRVNVDMSKLIDYTIEVMEDTGSEHILLSYFPLYLANTINYDIMSKEDIDTFSKSYDEKFDCFFDNRNIDIDSSGDFTINFVNGIIEQEG